MTKQLTSSTIGTAQLSFGKFGARAMTFFSAVFAHGAAPYADLNARLRYDIGKLDRNPDLLQASGRASEDCGMELMRRSF